MQGYRSKHPDVEATKGEVDKSKLHLKLFSETNHDCFQEQEQKVIDFMHLKQKSWTSQNIG